MSDHGAALTGLETAHRQVDAVRFETAGRLFEVLLTRIAADQSDGHAEQLAKVRQLATLGLPPAPGEREAVHRLRCAAFEWVDGLLPVTNLCAAAERLDSTPNAIRTRLRQIALGRLCLPQATEYASKHLLSYDRYHYAIRQAARLELVDLAEYDDRVVRVRAVDMAGFKRGINQITSYLSTRETQTRRARETRGVDFFYEPAGIGTLIARGPTPAIALLEARLTGMARAILTGNTDCFDIPEGHTIEDTRSMRQLLFDFLTTSQPTGTTTTSTETRVPADNDSSSGEGSLKVLAACPAGIDIDATAENYRRHYQQIGISCPTEAEWLKRQARITITVPALTLLTNTAGAEGDGYGTGHLNLNEDDVGRGHGDRAGPDEHRRRRPGSEGHRRNETKWPVREVPGVVNGAPIPADMARQLVGSGHPVVYRLLTDPVSGVPLDHVAEKYTIPEPMRIALVEKWQFCTLPGCPRSAVKAELDHIIPFNHRNPAAGGKTTMGNLHPLCREHHQMKTQKIISVRKDESTGMLHWQLPGGVTTTSYPADQPINQAHTEQLHARTRSRELNATGG